MFDNYDYAEPPYELATEFTTYEQALAAAKAIVDEFLLAHFDPGMTTVTPERTALRSLT